MRSIGLVHRALVAGDRRRPRRRRCRRRAAGRRGGRVAIRRSAESGSPWLPVEMTTTFSSGKSSISRGWMKIPSGAFAIPRLEAMLKFLRIERPTSATLRSSRAAASITCWTRWMLEANEVTMIRPLQRPNCWSRAGPTADSEGAMPGRSALVESPQSSGQAFLAELGEAGDVGRAAIDRGLVELVVAGHQHRARHRSSTGPPRMSGIEWARWISSISNGPQRASLAGRQLLQWRLVAELVLVRAWSGPSRPSAGRRRSSGGISDLRGGRRAAPRHGPRGRG